MPRIVPDAIRRGLSAMSAFRRRRNTRSSASRVESFSGGDFAGGQAMSSILPSSTSTTSRVSVEAQASAVASTIAGAFKASEVDASCPDPVVTSSLSMVSTRNPSSMSLSSSDPSHSGGSPLGSHTAVGVGFGMTPSDPDYTGAAEARVVRTGSDRDSRMLRKSILLPGIEEGRTALLVPGVLPEDPDQGLYGGSQSLGSPRLPIAEGLPLAAFPSDKSDGEQGVWFFSIEDSLVFSVDSQLTDQEIFWAPSP